MKKLLLGIIVLGISGATMAQEAADKKVQAGLVFGTGMNFQKMGTKLMTTDGIGSDWTVGTNLSFTFNETVGFCTGVEFDFSTMNYAAAAGNEIYYVYNDSEILQQADVASSTGSEIFRLSTRKQKATYLTVPTMLLFRTNFIGYFRYFGKFGLRNSFLLSSKITDQGSNLTPDDEILGVEEAGTNSNMSAKGDMFFFKSAVGLAGGTEWNFTGSTSLAVEIGYYYGFTPLHLDRKTEKTTLYTAAVENGTSTDNNFSNQATQTQLMLKVSLLF
ncbi:MAG: PorT family protein [Crocinitomicaceae bacterium]|nr:PorT family protein [Crocinitomicaceae bacterium]